jgi:hypothetical protein
MAKGVPTSEEKIAAFRAHYLVSGVVSESAKHVELAERTAYDVAARLQKDETFAEERRALRARYLDDLVAMRMRVARKALARFEDDTQLPPEAIDKRPDYGRLVNEAEKNAHNLAKIENPQDDRGGATEVHIHLAGEDSEPETVDGQAS